MMFNQQVQIFHDSNEAAKPQSASGYGGPDHPTRLMTVVIRQNGGTYLHMNKLGGVSQPTDPGHVLHEKYWVKSPRGRLWFFSKPQKQVVSVGVAYSELSPADTSAYLARHLPVRVRIEAERYDERLTRAFHKPSLRTTWPDHTHSRRSSIHTSLSGDGLPVVIIGWPSQSGHQR